MTMDLEALQRDAFLLTVLVLFALERFRALQRHAAPGRRRWTSNVGLFLIGAVVGTLILPAGTYAFAARQPPGVLTRLGMPLAAQVIVTFLLLDLWKYWEHRVFHAVPFLWRFHLVHHSDTALDVTTSERHHPGEVVLGIAIMAALVWTLGLPPAALGLYLIVASVVALYSHANLRLSAALDRALSRVLVTGPVHGVHHSDLRAETDSNFGAVLTVWDRWFGTFVEPSRARIPHVGLDYFHRPSDTRLWGVLLQPLRFRRDLDYPARDDAAREPPLPPRHAAPAWRLAPASRTALLYGAIGAVLVLIAMGSTVVEMTAVWHAESYQYAWLVLPMLVYVVGWHDESLRGALAPQPSATGVWVALGAGLCWGAASLVNLDVARQLALVVALHGVALATLGWRSYRRWFAALALLFFMVPCGDLLLPALRLLTLRSIELVTWIAQLPHVVDGFVISVGARRYIVIDECAGLSYVTLAAFLGYCFGLLLYGSFLRSAGLALAGALIGIASNVIRVNAIVLIDWARDSQLDLTAHGTLQWLMLLAALAVLLYLLARSRPAPGAVAAGEAPASMPASVARYAPLLAGACAAAIALAATALPATDVRAAHDAVVFPTRLSGFALTQGDRAWTIDRGGRTQSIRARYVRDERALEATLVQTRSADAKLVESALAPAEPAVWREKALRRERACVADDCVTLVHVTWKKEQSDDLAHAYFAYAVGARLTDSRLAARAYGLHRVLGEREPPALVAIVSPFPLDVYEAAAALQRLHAALRDASASGMASARAE
jgi:exosortase